MHSSWNKIHVGPRPQ